MSYSNPHRRQRTGETTVSGTVKTLATTAVVAYGAYQAYQFLTDQDSSQDNNGQDQTILSSLPRWVSSLWNNNDHAGNYHHHQQQRRRPRPQSPKEIRTRHRLAQQSRQNCRHKVLEAYTKCWPAILQVIEDSTNTATLTQELRTLRQQQSTLTTQQPQDSTSSTGSESSPTTTSTSHLRQRQDELWNRIQRETITKFVSTIYSSSLLFLSLTMQLHWINGQVFQQQQQHDPTHNANSASTATTTREAQHLMMQAHNYMTLEGIPILIAAIRRAITSSTLEQYAPTTMVSIQDIDHALDQIENYLENGTSTSHSRNWIRNVLPDPILHQHHQQEQGFFDARTTLNNHDDDDDDDDEAEPGGTAMLEAWWDIAESPAWQDAQQQTIHSIRHYLRDKGWGQAFPQRTNHQSCNMTTSDDECANASAHPQVPLAKLMAPFKASTGLVQGDCTLPDGKTPGKSMNTTKSKNNVTFFRQVQSLATVLELGDVSFQEWSPSRSYTH